MTPPLPPRTRARSRLVRDDRGSTLLAAILVTGVALSLSLLMLTVAITSGRTTGADRQRLAAVHAAEASVDAAYVSIQGSGLSLPCAWPATGTQDVGTAPDRTVTRATIVYTGASGASGCPLAPGDTPVRAAITGTGTAGGATGQTRAMQALVDLEPRLGGALDKALFGDQELLVEQSGTVRAAPGQRADVHTNGSFTCGNSARFPSSVLAPTGSITMTGTCEAAGDVWANGAVTLAGNKTIGGRVLSTTSSITAAGNSSVNGTLMARGAISWSGCTVPAKCLAGQSAVPAPPVSTFPQIRGDAASLAIWTTSAGYAHVPLPSGTCGANAGDWLKARVGVLTERTLFTTPCHVEFRNTKSTRFSADVAVFARGGVSTSNQVDLSSTNGPHDVQFIQPSDAVLARPCTTLPVAGTPVMGPSQSYTSSADLSVLWYSPCDIAYGNSATSYGQVVSGSRLVVNNSFDLTFRKVKLPATAVGGATTSYGVGVVYKRETQAP